VIDKTYIDLVRLLLESAPAIRWKLQNLAKLKQSNPRKFAQQAAELREQLGT
jgi:hypothetical protein